MKNTLVVEDQNLLRDALVSLCRKELGYSPICEAKDGDEALVVSRKQKPDLILLDIFIPKQDGIQLSEIWKTELPNTKILAISGDCDEYNIYRISKAFVHGFFDKRDDSMLELKKAIKRVAAGAPYYSKIYQVSWCRKAGQVA